jgi:hypothetical protein
MAAKEKDVNGCGKLKRRSKSPATAAIATEKLAIP